MPLLPMTVSADDVREAANIIKAAAHRTPVLTSTQANALTGASLFLSVKTTSVLAHLNFAALITQ